MSHFNNVLKESTDVTLLDQMYLPYIDSFVKILKKLSTKHPGKLILSVISISSTTYSGFWRFQIIMWLFTTRTVLAELLTDLLAGVPHSRCSLLLQF